MTKGHLEKILVIKHGALGDIIQAFDGFATIRAGHPNAQISLLTTAPFEGLTRSMPFFDEVLIDPRAKFWNLRVFFKMRQIFRSGWTRIYDLQSSSRTRSYFNTMIPKDVEFVGVHKGVSHLVPDLSGINNRDRMVRSAEIGGCCEVDAPTDWLSEGRPDTAPKGKYAVLIPGCSPVKPQKKWRGEGYAEVADHLIQNGVTPVLAGTKLDRKAGDDVLAQMSHRDEACDLIGKTSLMGLAGLLRDAELIIGNDTGPVFLAARLGRPTLMVMSGHTDPTMSAPYGPKAEWIRCEHLDDLSAADVIQKINEMMS